jgi:Flp pilus assembly protein TadB
LNSLPVTHPESAWLAVSVPLWLLVAGILGVSVLLRGRAMEAAARLLERRQGEGEPVDDPALLWAPPITTPGQLLAAAIAASLIVIVALSFLAPLFVAVVLAPPAASLLVWGMLRLQEARYIARLDDALPAVVGRLAGYLNAGGGFQSALGRVVTDLPDGPLRGEWSFLAERLAAPVSRVGVAAPGQVVAALARQTPSRRHAAFLSHLEVALGQTHDVLTRRVAAAADALQAAERRRSAASTELAQMRYSGFAIGMAGLGMAGYLGLSQPDRVARAYQGPLGLAAGLLVAAALLAPIIGGMLLARVDDIDY